MRVLKWSGMILVLLALLGAVAWVNRVDVLLLMARLNIPHVEANHPVVWAAGPDSADRPVDRRPPNIVLILADDLGFNDITLHGGGVANGAVPTPAIDSLAHDGVEMTNGYAGDATCAPSRAAIMTGRYATRFGFEFTPTPVVFSRIIADMESDKLHPAQFHGDVVENIPPLDKLAVPVNEITIAEMVRKQGYHTVHLGKWHLGGAPGSRPEDKGFDESLGFTPGASMYLPEEDPDVENSKQDFDPIDRFLWHGLPWGVQFNGSPWFRPKGYMTDYLTDQAIAAIHANRNRPFLLYFAPNAVHTPLQATKEDYAALPQIQDHRLRVYAAMIRNLDRNIGRLTQALKDEGLDGNTLVIFTSDNGGAHYIGLPDINRPYRGWKATFFEGGMHVPFTLTWPGHIQAGSTYRAPVAHVDIFATALAAANGAMPTDRTMDGVDLLPFINGKAGGEPHKTLFWRSGNYAVVMSGGWKLQRMTAPSKQFLFNLALDPTEQHNLVASEPDKLRELTALMDQIDQEQAKPLWPSLVSAAIAIDHPGGMPILPSDDYIVWDN